MSEKIVVPVLGESITEATVAKWLKKTGDAVEADEPIVELETDKVNLEVPSPITGVLTEINSQKSRAEALLLNLNRRLSPPGHLAFRELEAPAGFRLAILLTLDNTRVAGQEAAGLQRRAQARLEKRQRAADAVADSAGLAGQATTLDGGDDVDDDDDYHYDDDLKRMPIVLLISFVSFSNS